MDMRKKAESVLGYKPSAGKKLGDGFYSNVYEVRERPDVVVKISGKGDYAYHAFIDYIDCNPNKHFPQVYVHFVDSRGRTYTVLERLENLNALELAAWNMFYYTVEEESECMTWESVDGRVDWDYMAERMGMNADNHEHFYLIKNMIQTTLPEPLLDIAFKLIYDRGSFRSDMHDGNVMVRIEGDKRTLVITDPWSGGYSDYEYSGWSE